MKIQTGTPPEPGRYVIYTPCKSSQVREWCEPHIATWYDGRWVFGDPVRGWIGPLPVVHGKNCLPAFSMSPVEDWAEPGEPLREYDL